MDQAENTNTVAAEVAAGLLNAGAIRLQPKNPFTWSSGWKSPIYCDNRISLSFPELRTFIKVKLSELIRAHFPDAEAIAGVATAGIPQGALIADYLDLPFLYVRSKPKGHGMTNQIEGKATPGQRVVVVEDLISTGGSSLKAVEALRSADVSIEGLVAIFTYGFDLSIENFEQAKVPFYCLSDYPHLLEEALKRGIIKEDEVDVLAAWRKDPANWQG
ncbi:orotate phosphoribosyltransferase [Roseivirga sp. BDSF3-8]|uniref:orotate phosphoribosyltransferase n=1 Tax=Roseivirga sp. BDSF3-8 TaxID=3241598 RepID=UPI0035327572